MQCLYGLLMKADLHLAAFSLSQKTDIRTCGWIRTSDAIKIKNSCCPNHIRMALLHFLITIRQKNRIFVDFTVTVCWREKGKTVFDYQQIFADKNYLVEQTKAFSINYIKAAFPFGSCSSCLCQQIPEGLTSSFNMQCASISFNQTQGSSCRVHGCGFFQV